MYEVTSCGTRKIKSPVVPVEPLAISTALPSEPPIIELVRPPVLIRVKSGVYALKSLVVGLFIVMLRVM